MCALVTGVQTCALPIYNLAEAGVDALIAIGGEDTLGVATKLADLGVNVVGVPKTIDNELSGTDFTLGFETEVNIDTEAIDRIDRKSVVEGKGGSERGDFGGGRISKKKKKKRTEK